MIIYLFEIQIQQIEELFVNYIQQFTKDRVTTLLYFYSKLMPIVFFFPTIKYIIIKFPYNARFDSLKQRPLSENKVQVNDIKLAFKFLLRNFDKFDPN